MDAPWTTLRTLVAHVGEAIAAPVSATCIDIGADSPKVEVRVASGASTPSAPTSVVLTVWRDAGGVDRIGTVTIAAADIAMSIPQVFTFNARKVYVTVSFVGGSSPTLTGVVQARPIFGV